MNTPWSVLILDDDPGVRQSIRLCLEVDGARVRGVGTSAGALEALERGRFDVVFLDLWLKAESGLAVLPRMLRRQPAAPVIVITAYASYESAVEAMKLGAVDYLPKPFTPEQVRNAARRAVSETLLKRQLSELRERIHESEAELVFETRDPAYKAFLQTVQRVASSDSVVLLRGESGTGKNVLARWMRDRSRRSERRFVTVHCPMLSNELMSSTLFGHCRGAFTSAVADAVGKVEEAEGGTLFLDEVGDLSVDAQARLLRFLNDRSYERLGEAKERQADVRIIAATNRALENEVKAGRFREDLFFRLNVITLTIPPLRNRPQDIVPLAKHYLRFFERRQGRRDFTFSPRCEAELTNYSWPGNYRELRNAVERATILAPTVVIESEDLGFILPSSDSPRGAAVALGGNVSLDDLEREHIARVVSRTSSFEAAAKILGIDVTTLQRKRKRYGLA